MKLSDVYQIADELAPLRLSKEFCENYGAYDNSGILVDTGDDVKGILFTLDLSLAAIAKAKALGANLIITHHPAIYGKIDSVCVGNSLGQKLVDCIKNGISVLSMHLNLDGAEHGIDESLMQGICKAANSPSGQNQSVYHTLSNGGYGRVYDVTPCSLKTLVLEMEKEFSTKRILYYGKDEREIKRVASFCGAGVEDGSVAKAIENEGGKADVIVSSDFKHHFITGALEQGLAVIILTHYASENYGYKKYYEKIRQRLEIPCAYHTDEELL